jgi:hypothetical protein
VKQASRQSPGDAPPGFVYLVGADAALFFVPMNPSEGAADGLLESDNRKNREGP